jgi:small membrane protein
MIAQSLFTLLLGAVLVYARSQYRSAPVIALLAAAIALAGLYFVWLPAHATALAFWLGIGRGVDLLLYSWMAFSLVALLNLHLKIRAQTELITQLARSMALANANADRLRSGQIP